MKFSIITASFNQNEYLPRCLESVQGQTYRNFEHLIHDGLSTDGSQDTLRTYAASFNNASVVIEKDSGQVEAINNGLSRSSGDILVWLNSDDFLFDSNTLTIVAKVFEDKNVDVAYGKGYYVDIHGKRLRDVYVKRKITSESDLLSSIGIFQPALYFRRSAFERLGGLDGRYQLTLDYEYWIRFLQAGLQFHFIDDYLAKATLHDESKTCGSRTAQLIETILLLKQKFGYVHPDWTDRLYEHLVFNNDWTATARKSEPAAVENRPPKLDSNHPLTVPQAELPPKAQLNAGALSVGQNLKPLRRVVVTSFNQHYFVQGLNLLSSLHVYCRDAIDLIVVYDLGLTEQQRSLLNCLEGVVCRRYPANEPWSGYYHPKSYMYKCFAIYAARDLVDEENGIVLWIDAGVSVTSPMDAVFRILDSRGIFLVNHDDRKNNCLVNAAFTHPRQTEALNLGFRELSADHVCSCVLGYKRGTSGETLVKKVFDLSLTKELNFYTKHPDKKWLKSTFFESALIPVTELLSSTNPSSTAFATLARFPYFGHRQDQSLYSNVAALMCADVYSASIFCPATDYSSKVSFENWRSGGEFSEIVRSADLPSGHCAPMIHHRGTYTNLSGLQFDRRAFIAADVAFVLGNGPSLKDVPFTDFRGIATIGMNAAYRYWDEHGWYPSYYCCMDTVVIMSHAEHIYRLIEKADSYGIKLFFLRRVILEKYPDLENNWRVLFLEDLRPLTPLFQVEPITTGSYSLLFMAFLGFRNIYVAGVDCNYVERVKGVVDGDKKNKLVIAEELSENPNYFFASYQRPGDEFNVPNPSKDLHVRSWRNSAEALQKQQGRLGRVSVTNLNPASRVDCFDNAQWQDAIAAVRKQLSYVAHDLVKAFAVDDSLAPRLVDELEQVLAKGVTGRHPGASMPPKPSHQSVELATTTLRVRDNRAEFRLQNPLPLQANEVLTAVALVYMKNPMPFVVTLLHISAWQSKPSLKVESWIDGSPVFNESQALYLIALDEHRSLLLVNNSPTRPVLFEGVGVDSMASLPDGGDFSVEFLEVSSFCVSPRAPTEEAPLTKKVSQAGKPPESTLSAKQPPNKVDTAPVASDGPPQFSDALARFRAGDYQAALHMARRLQQDNPNFRWYGELAKASLAKLESKQLT